MDFLTDMVVLICVYTQLHVYVYVMYIHHILSVHRNVPEHDRLVGLQGSVIDYMYGGGTTPAVLIVMERMHRDFYTAIKTGFDWMNRYMVHLFNYYYDE